MQWGWEDRASSMLAASLPAARSGGQYGCFPEGVGPAGKLPSRAHQNQATGILPEEAQSSEKEKVLSL